MKKPCIMLTMLLTLIFSFTVTVPSHGQWWKNFRRKPATQPLQEQKPVQEQPAATGQESGTQDVRPIEAHPMQQSMYSFPRSSTGIISGAFTNPNVSSSSGDYFDFGFIKTVSIAGFTRTYGTTIEWLFNTDGAVTYNYAVPFRVAFTFPMNVYPGQSIYLEPDFTFTKTGGGTSLSMTANQHYKFSHVTDVWLDAPDGLDELTTTFTQYADKANIAVKIPVVPGFDSVSGAFDCTIWPCNTGGGNYGGSYTKLGGSGNLNISGADSFNVSPSTISITSLGTSSPAWKQGHEQFELTAYVLGVIPTPVTVAAAGALTLMREIGDLRLYTQLDATIGRRDIIHLQITDISPVNVPGDLQGQVWHFTDLPVKVKYRVKFESWFYYPMGYNVTFDMIGIDQQTLLHADLINVPGGGTDSGWIEREGEFKISGSVPVVAAPVRPPVSSLSAAYRQNLMIAMKDAPLLPRSHFRLATKKDTQRMVRTTKSFPKPAPPQPGQYTVMIGRFPASRVAAVMNDLKSKRLDPLALSIKGSTDAIIILGSFRDHNDAKLLSNAVKEAVNVTSTVTQNPYGSAPAKKGSRLPAQQGRPRFNRR